MRCDSGGREPLARRRAGTNVNGYSFAFQILYQILHQWGKNQ